MASRDYDWRCKPGWPYKGNDHPERDPKYIKTETNCSEKVVMDGGGVGILRNLKKDQLIYGLAKGLRCTKEQ